MASSSTYRPTRTAPRIRPVVVAIGPPVRKTSVRPSSPNASISRPARLSPPADGPSNACTDSQSAQAEAARRPFDVVAGGHAPLRPPGQTSIDDERQDDEQRKEGPRQVGDPPQVGMHVAVVGMEVLGAGGPGRRAVARADAFLVSL